MVVPTFLYFFVTPGIFREGFNREGNMEARGIIPRAIEQIFGHIQSYASPRMRFLVRASYLQIYNEQVFLLFFVLILDCFFPPRFFFILDFGFTQTRS
jgi:hypothetical protein